MIKASGIFSRGDAAAREEKQRFEIRSQNSESRSEIRGKAGSVNGRWPIVDSRETKAEGRGPELGVRGYFRKVEG